MSRPFADGYPTKNLGGADARLVCERVSGESAVNDRFGGSAEEAVVVAGVAAQECEGVIGSDVVVSATVPLAFSVTTRDSSAV